MVQQTRWCVEARLAARSGHSFSQPGRRGYTHAMNRFSRVCLLVLTFNGAALLSGCEDADEFPSEPRRNDGGLQMPNRDASFDAQTDAQTDMDAGDTDAGDTDAGQ